MSRHSSVQIFIDLFHAISLATPRVNLARHHTKTLFSFAISAGGSGSTKSYAKIEQSLAVIKTRLALDDFVLRNGREIAGKSDCG